MISTLSLIISILALCVSLGCFQIHVEIGKIIILGDYVERLFTYSDKSIEDTKYTNIIVYNYSNRDILWKIKGGYIRKGKYGFIIPTQYHHLKANSKNDIKLLIEIDYKFDGYDNEQALGKLRYGILPKKFRDIEWVSSSNTRSAYDLSFDEKKGD